MWLAVLLVACNADRIASPGLSPSDDASYALSATGGDVVISQVYGGGGNAGATLKNDFIELHNRSAVPVSVAGWSVQYASATGSSWQVTPLTGIIPAGGYYLIQEAAGTGGTTALPTPDVVGTIPMGGTAGKVALFTSTGAGSGTCPAAAIDIVSFGGTATNCGMNTTATLSNTTAALRADNACKYTSDLSVDFTTGAPAPRNSTSPTNTCDLTPVGPLDHVVIAGAATVSVGNSTQLTATGEDASGKPVSGAVYQWTSSNTDVATVDASGKVTGVAVDAAPVTITVKATKGGIEKTASHQITVTLPNIAWIDASSSSTSFPPGFQTQMFFTARVASQGTIIPAIFTVESLDPTIATMAIVKNTGIVTGIAPQPGSVRPRFRITATPVAGGTPYSFTTSPITIETPVSAPVDIYSKNDEFGDPTPASAGNPNDMLIVRPQFTISYNQSRGTPNWVSYELDSRQVVGGIDRCNCFTADPLLPAAKQIFTSDYTNGGYDRGHMAPSADRSAANVDNASTFYLTNIVPQQGDLNQGVWANLENALRDSVRAGRAVYIITGPLYSRANTLRFVNDSGKVAIPDSTWKVAFIGPRTAGVPFDRSSIQSFADIANTTVMAVNMPNISGIRNDPWSKYLTTVDAIEAATGYDLLDLLPDNLERAVEAGDRPPVASVTGSSTGLEGSEVSFSAAGSTDPDAGDALTYAWSFGDGSTAAGVTATHEYADEGTYTVTLTVTDSHGVIDAATKTVTIANVAPTVSAIANGTILRGESYSAGGTFSDPGADSWTATVNYGDGSGVQPLGLSGSTFSLIHNYSRAGTFTVTVTVSDGDVGGTSTRTATVKVLSADQGIDVLSDKVSALETAGTLTAGESNALDASLRAALKTLDKDNATPAQNQLEAFINKVEAMQQSGRISSATASALIDYARRVIASM